MHKYAKEIFEFAEKVGEFSLEFDKLGAMVPTYFFLKSQENKPVYDENGAPTIEGIPLRVREIVAEIEDSFMDLYYKIYTYMEESEDFREVRKVYDLQRLVKYLEEIIMGLGVEYSPIITRLRGERDDLVDYYVRVQKELEGLHCNLSSLRDEKALDLTRKEKPDDQRRIEKLEGVIAEDGTDARADGTDAGEDGAD